MRPEQREYILKYMDSKSAAEISQELGLKERKVKKFLDSRKEMNQQLRSTVHNKRRVLFSFILIVAMGFSVYINSFDNKFLWDDVSLVEKNVHIKDYSNLSNILTQDIMAGAGKRSNYYRPLQMVSYMVDYAVWGLNPKGYHLTNTMVHICAALALYWLVNMIFHNNLLSVLTGILFVIHPVHTEAVTYVSGRADPLALLFMLLCFIFYIEDLSSKKIHTLFFMISSFALALMSRENSLILPALLVLYHYSFKKRIQLRGALAILGVTFAYIVFRVVILKVVSTHVSHVTTLFERLPGLFAAITNYVALLFLPFDLHMEYGIRTFHWGELKVILGIVLLLILIIYALRRRENNQLMSFSIMWFLVSLLPVSNLFPINAYMAEHWLYVPSIGFFLVVAKTICSLFEAKAGYFRAVIAVFSIGTIIFYSHLTIKQNTYWREPLDYYERMLKYAPDSAKLYDNLGVIYSSRDRKEDALEAYKKAIELDPAYAGAHNNLGAAYNELNQRGKAVEMYKKAIDIDPGYAEAYYNLGVAYYALGKKNESIASYLKAVNIYPDYAGAYNNLGAVYYAMEEKEAAIASYRRAVEINPKYAGAYINLGIIYNDMGRKEEAIAAYMKAMNIDPNYAGTYYNLGIIYNDMKRKEEAILAYKKAIEIDPQYAGAYNNLAVIYFHQKQYGLAVKNFDQAERLGYFNPSFREALKPYR